jgi:hypothetical protein
MASTPTMSPATTAAAIARRSRSGVLIALTVRRNTAKPIVKRPAMCSAFTRPVGAIRAETVIAASRAIQGDVSGVCQRGQVPDETIDQSHAQKTTARTPSTLLTDCHGRRTSGRNSSNGAMIASAQTPTYAVLTGAC